MVKTLHPLGPITSQIDLPPEVRVPIDRNSDASVEDVLSAVAVDPAVAARQALESPLEYPPIAQGIVSGDHVAIAVDESIPNAPAVVRGVVAAVEAAGVEPDAIAVVASDEDFCRLLRDALGDAIRVVVHDPEDLENLCLVGLNEKNQPLLFNRTVSEADVVLPIGCARLATTAGGGVFEGLFPCLSDAETIERLRTPSQRSSAKRRAAARHEADHAGWLLGVPMTMQVVPGRDGTIAAVVAGDPRAVAKYCQDLCEQLWAFTVPQRARLVIANVTGGDQEQTWENVARALAVTENLVAEGGAVAICSDLEAVPGPALRRLTANADLDAIERDTRNDHSPDGWPAWLLARALQRGPVYFLSQLDPDDVEELGLAPVADISELARLAGRQESCIILDDSQYAVATVAGES